jgi:hypothetical protein
MGVRGYPCTDSPSSTTMNPRSVAAWTTMMLDDPVSRRNIARFTFFSPLSAVFYPDWEQGADAVVASLRRAAGQNPHDKGLTDLIGELVTRSDPFRVRWSAHNVRFHRTGTKRIRHPEVGDLEFTFEGVDLPASPGWVMFAYTTAAGSLTEDRVKLLGSLAASEAAGDNVSRPTPTG